MRRGFTPVQNGKQQMKAFFAVVVAVALLPRTAAAQDARTGFYLELRGGAVFLEDTELDDPDGEAATLGITDIEATFDTGFLLEGAAGYGHEIGLRGELAVGYRETDLDDLTANIFGGAATADVTGHVSTYSILTNVYYDFRFDFPVMPFAGAGIGIAAVNLDLDGQDDTDLVFAWQATGGVAYPITENIAATLSYVFFSSVDPEFDGFKANYDSHNVILGVRYVF